MDEIRRRHMRLPVKLTEEELDKKKGELVEWVRVRAENEHQLESWVADMKEQKKLKEAEILSAAGYANRAADIIEAREERRDVEVGDYFDGGNVVTVRLDTGETVATRPATEEERQLLLPVEKAPLDEPGEPLECSCEDSDVAAIDCPIHGPDGVGEPEPEEENDGSPNDGVS
jgi:hypothetical protein